MDCKFKGKLKEGFHFINGNKTMKAELFEDNFSYFSSNTFIVIIGIALLIAFLTLTFLKLNDSKKQKLESQNYFNNEFNRGGATQ